MADRGFKSNVNVDGLVTANSLQLIGGAGTQGTMSWNVDEETIDVVQNGAVLQVGQELQTHCRNNTASTIANGTVVMATGTIGASGRITIAPYDNAADVKYILGIATEDIAADEDGKVTTFGKVRDLDTSSYSEGTVLYTTTNGGLTDVEPTTGVKMAIAFVVTSHASVGTIMVRVTPLDENVYQEQLVSGTNIKTINGSSLLGSGDLTVLTTADIDSLGELNSIVGVTLDTSSDTRTPTDNSVTKSKLATRLSGKTTLTNQSGTITIDLSLGIHWDIALTGNVTAINFSNATSDDILKTITLKFTGNYSVVLPTGVQNTDAWDDFDGTKTNQCQIYIYDVASGTSITASSTLLNW